MLGFILRNTIEFENVHALKMPYYSFFRSNLEFGSFMWAVKQLGFIFRSDYTNNNEYRSCIWLILSQPPNLTAGWVTRREVIISPINWLTMFSISS